MNAAPPSPEPEPDWIRHLQLQAELLDGIEVAMCAFDLADRTLVWNKTFLRFFPEHAGHIAVGEPYGANLRRFYERRLAPGKHAQIDRYVDAAIARHQRQSQPYEFEHGGKWVRVSSLPCPGRGRIRVWRSLEPLPGRRVAPLEHELLEHDLLEHAPEALLVCAPDGGVSWVNATFCTLFGVPDRTSVLGGSLEDLYLATWARVAPAEAARQQAGLAVLRENLSFPGAPFELPLPHDTTCRVLARPAGNGANYYALLDVTALKRYETALQLTLDNAGRGIIRYDAAGRILLFNRQARELLELPEELLASGTPSVTDVVRFQRERGDLEVDIQFANPLPPDGDIAALLYVSGKYLRRTRSGRVLEVATEALPDGGAVRTYSDVTAYMEAQQALAEKSRALEITLDSMSQGISALDAGGRLVFWNRRYQEMLDLPTELLEQQPTMEQLVRFQTARGDFGPDFSLVDAIARGYDSVGDRMSPLRGPDTYVRKTLDGRMFDVTTRPLPDGGVVRTFTDISAYVATQELLARKEAQLSALVNNLPDRVWLKDQEGRHVLANPAHCKHHGVTEAQVIGRTSEELFGAETGARQAASDAQARQSARPVSFEQYEFGPDGELHCFEVVKVAMRDEASQCVGLLAIARDITRRKQQEEALIRAKEEAQLANRAKSRFLSNMSHEIRTPMNAILGMLTLLRGTPLSARQDDYAGKAEGAARSLLSLLNDILDFSKIEAGKMRLEARPFSLEGLLSDLAVILSTNLGPRELEVLYELDDRVPDLLVGDDMRLRQILINLGGNAIKFTERGEVVVRTRLVARDASHATIEFSVQDTGIGIAPEQQERLFSDFVQASEATARHYGGSGLGLGICRRLTELMGSRLQLASTPGAGSRFWFSVRLPLAAPQAREPAPQPQAQLRVLIVDDNTRARDALAALCRGCGWQADSAASGREALARVTAAAAGGHGYHAVFVDWVMPQLDGWQTCARIHALPLPEHPPLVALVSAQGREMLDQRPAADRALLQAYLVKPVTAGMLRAALQRARGGPAEGERRAPAVPVSQPLAGIELLLAEDNLVNQQIATELLARNGASVDVVGDGQQAVERLRSGKRYAAVLMDVQMPVMDGLEATRAIRASFGPEVLPIIAMTANAMESDRQDCFRAGMNDHVGKPFVIEEVVDAIRRHVLAPGRDRPAAPAPAAPAADFCRQYALERLGADEELLAAVLPVFRSSLEDTLRGLAQTPPAELPRLLHSLKGMAANVGADALAAAAASAERSLKADPADGSAQLEAVATAIRAVLGAIADW